MSWRDRCFARICRLDGMLRQVEPNTALSRLLIGSVAGKALCRKDRANLLRKIDAFWWFLTRPIGSGRSCHQRRGGRYDERCQPMYGVTAHGVRSMHGMNSEKS